jgi:Derlin-2/3
VVPMSTSCYPSSPSKRISTRSFLYDLRGGASSEDDNNEDEDESEDDEEIEDDEDASLFADDEVDFDERDFAGETTMDRLLLNWKRTPPFTKAYISATFGVAVYANAMNANQIPEFLSLDWTKILTKLQVWRLITAFFNFGPLGIGWFLTAHFVWTYMATLERLCHDRPYDFWIMILFGQLSMVVGYPLLGQNTKFLGHNLSTYLVYIWARKHEGAKVSMFDLFEARAELLPWIFLAQTFLLEGELPVLDFLGIVFGHLYYHCEVTGMLQAPKALVKWYKKSDNQLAVTLRGLYQPITSDFEII